MVAHDVAPIGCRDGVESILQRHTLRSGEPGHVSHHHRRSDAILIERLAAHEIPKRLLVAEDEALLRIGEHGVRDPLEAGERFLTCNAVRCRHPCEQR